MNLKFITWATGMLSPYVNIFSSSFLLCSSFVSAYVAGLYVTVRRLCECWRLVQYKCAATLYRQNCLHCRLSWHHHCHRLLPTQPTKRCMPAYLWLPVRYLWLLCSVCCIYGYWNISNSQCTSVFLIILFHWLSVRSYVWLSKVPLQQFI